MKTSLVETNARVYLDDGGASLGNTTTNLEDTLDFLPKRLKIKLRPEYREERGQCELVG